MISRQRKWQIEKVKQGLCKICGKRQIKGSKQFCEICLEKHKILNRKNGRNSYRKKIGVPPNTILQRSKICVICGKKQCGELKNHCEIYLEKYREYYRNIYRKKHGILLDAPLHKREKDFGPGKLYIDDNYVCDCPSFKVEIKKID